MVEDALVVPADAAEVLAKITEQYAARQLDAVCGFAVACGDRPEQISKEFILFQVRDGETEVPHDRSVAMLRGIARLMRGMADGMERMADEVERLDAVARDPSVN